MIVVFDSNAWISEIGLKSSAASAVKFYLKQEGARIGLPEVVRLEATAGLRKNLLKSIDQIKSEHRKLLAGVGKLKELILPTETEVNIAIAAAFGSLHADILDIPLSLESTRSALFKCIAKEQPCDTSEEFRDAIIWSDCLNLLNSDHVYFVTSDKAFYKDRKYEKGLARNLLNELTGAKHRLELFPDLSTLLTSIKKPVQIPIDTIVSQYLSTKPEILKKHSLTYSKPEKGKIDVFATEDSTQLYLNFEIGLICSDTSGQGLSDVLLHVTGDGIYYPNGKGTEVGHIWKEELHWLGGDRTKPSETRLYAFGMAHLGHKEISHEVRHKLDGDS